MMVGSIVATRREPKKWLLVRNFKSDYYPFILEACSFDGQPVERFVEGELERLLKTGEYIRLC